MQGSRYQQCWKKNLQAEIELLQICIDARFEEILSQFTILDDANVNGIDHACNAHYLVALIADQTDSLPNILARSALLQESWHTHRAWIAECRAEAEDQTRQDERTAKISALVAAGDWSNLDLPTPQEAISALLAGDALEANGHSALYDPGPGITWLTNAYGVDSALCGIPTLAVVTRFLEDMAYGRDYGPIP